VTTSHLAHKTSNQASLGYLPLVPQDVETLFWVQFLSFPVSTAQIYFGPNLSTFPGPESTRAGNVENKTQMTWFCTRIITTLFGGQFLSFHVSTAEKCFRPILMTFPDLDTIGTGKVENGAG